jgi:hypothetical protein
MKARNLDPFPSLLARDQENFRNWPTFAAIFDFKRSREKIASSAFSGNSRPWVFNRDLRLPRKVFNLHKPNSVASGKIVVFGYLKDPNLFASELNRCNSTGR